MAWLPIFDEDQNFYPQYTEGSVGNSTWDTRSESAFAKDNHHIDTMLERMFTLKRQTIRLISSLYSVENYSQPNSYSLRNTLWDAGLVRPMHGPAEIEGNTVKSGGAIRPEEGYLYPRCY